MTKAQQLVLNLLRRKDSQMADALIDCVNNNKSPKETLALAIQAGKVSPSDINIIKNNLPLIQRMTGLNISRNDLAELDKLFEQSNNSFRF